MLTMTIATPHQPYLLIYKLAPLKNTVTALLEYLDLTALLEYIDLINRYSKGPYGASWGPFQAGDWGKCPSCPSPPLWAALVFLTSLRIFSTTGG